MRRRIAIFCGGPSSEHEVSLSSAQAILKHIDHSQFEPYIFYIQKNLSSAFYKPSDGIIPPKNILFQDFEITLQNNKDNFDMALLSALHGEFGEDGTIQKKLSDSHIRFTGSNAKSSALCMNKMRTIKYLQDTDDLSFPQTKLISITDPIHFPFPFIVKPNSLGSSVLVSIVYSQEEYKTVLKKFKEARIDEILIQELITGIELSCGCLEKKDNTFIKLPPIEIHPNADFFDYSAKYKINGSKEITPPVSISHDESEKISNLAKEIHKKLRCKTYSRSDFIYTKKKIYFLETNTLPGFTNTSLFPQEVNAIDISFQELISFIIEQS